MRRYNCARLLDADAMRHDNDDNEIELFDPLVATAGPPIITCATKGR